MRWERLGEMSEDLINWHWKPSVTELCELRIDCGTELVRRERLGSEGEQQYWFVFHFVDVG